MKSTRNITHTALLLLGMLTGAKAQSVFVNELIYDSKILVDGKFENSVPPLIELAGPAGTNLNGWTIVLYDGANERAGVPYNTRKLTGTIPDQEGGFGTVAFTYPAATLQTGPHDGIALVDASGKVVQFISYEGAFMASSGPAKGMTAQNIGVSHSSTRGKDSLQLSGTGSEYKDFKWSGLFDSTPGEVNNKFHNDKQLFRKP